MSDKLWFKAKTLGWGWVPCSSEGATVLGVWVIVFGLSIVLLIGHPFFLLASIFIETAILLWICYKKGEEIPYLPRKKSNKK